MPYTPLVSVIIPTYNRARIISRTIANIFEQTYKHFEVVVVDDGSTDETVSLLRRDYGKKIRLVTQENAGPAAARNNGVRMAQGEIIAFQDSDDLWKSTKLERQIALLTAAGATTPCCLCNADMGSFRGKPRTSFMCAEMSPQHGEGLWLNVLEVLATRFVLFNQTVAIWRDAFDRVGGYDETLKYLEDYDLPLRLAFEGRWAFIEEPLVIYSGASDGSFSQLALKDPLTLKRCELKIFERTISNIGDNVRYGTAKQLLNRRLKVFRLGVTEIELARGGGHFRGTAATLLGKFSHYRDAFFRRTPWYPKMLTAPIVIDASNSTAHGGNELVRMKGPARLA